MTEIEIAVELMTQNIDTCLVAHKEGWDIPWDILQDGLQTGVEALEKCEKESVVDFKAVCGEMVSILECHVIPATEWDLEHGSRWQSPTLCTDAKDAMEVGLAALRGGEESMVQAISDAAEIELPCDEWAEEEMCG